MAVFLRICLMPSSLGRSGGRGRMSPRGDRRAVSVRIAPGSAARCPIRGSWAGSNPGGLHQSRASEHKPEALHLGISGSNQASGGMACGMEGAQAGELLITRIRFGRWFSRTAAAKACIVLLLSAWLRRRLCTTHRLSASPVCCCLDPRSCARVAGGREIRPASGGWLYPMAAEHAQAASGPNRRKLDISQIIP